ncbi:MAG: protein of unknown function DUF2849 [Roseibaca calidilacus]|uniref:DUF2849 domain-containing protein n=1 Tax=Roseibaca calidilacus TaxID=1666912 RepID=A0A0N8K8A4_9RHOB|nr:DUF2849 domain-containing protein [Roseibaca calidilacus]KPP93985.1 MAG: protein of unknown function DUF2849 [Roseibaca calidilacus]CUX79469.1 Protein of unknown function (DUF2849) [Roseibaca calidilacus]
MSRHFTPSVLTANDLLEGDVIYLAASGDWVRELSQARLFTDAREAAEALDAAEGQQDRLVGAYLAPAQASADGPKPGHFREAFRAKGPSNYAHGKQAHA